VRRFYKRGHHPNSLANLRPCKKGQHLNPNGRAGKNALGQYWVDKRWQRYVADIAKAERLLDRAMRKNLGCSLNQAWDRLKKR
jgi:hypothetical protein